jgi:hypothetical protein
LCSSINAYFTRELEQNTPLPFLIYRALFSAFDFLFAGLLIQRHGAINYLFPETQLLEDRYLQKSTVITSQLPVSHWHEHLNDATLADAILDRLIHNAIKLELAGESLRKTKNALQTEKL